MVNTQDSWKFVRSSSIFLHITISLFKFLGLAACLANVHITKRLLGTNNGKQNQAERSLVCETNMIIFSKKKLASTTPALNEEGIIIYSQYDATTKYSLKCFVSCSFSDPQCKSSEKNLYEKNKKHLFSVPIFLNLRSP